MRGGYVAFGLVLLVLVWPAITDAQSVWQIDRLDTDQTLHAVWGASATDVFAVGSGGEIYHFDGASWLPMDAGTSDGFLDVYGTSGSDVYAITATTLYHYEGSAWSVASVPIDVYESLPTTELHTLGGGAGEVYLGGHRIHGEGTSARAYPSVLNLGGGGHPCLTWTQDQNVFAIWAESAAFPVISLRSGPTIAPDEAGTECGVGTSPTPRMNGELYSSRTATNGPRDMWGTSRDDLYSASGAGLRHWAGSEWTSLGGGPRNTLWGVDGVVFTGGDGSGSDAAIALWDGTSLTNMEAPDDVGTVTDIWAASRDLAFATESRVGVVLRYAPRPAGPAASAVFTETTGNVGVGDTLVIEYELTNEGSTDWIDFTVDASFELFVGELEERCEWELGELLGVRAHCVDETAVGIVVAAGETVRDTIEFRALLTGPQRVSFDVTINDVEGNVLTPDAESLYFDFYGGAPDLSVAFDSARGGFVVDSDVELREPVVLVLTAETGLAILDGVECPGGVEGGISPTTPAFVCTKPLEELAWVPMMALELPTRIRAQVLPNVMGDSFPDNNVVVADLPETTERGPSSCAASPGSRPAPLGFLFAAIGGAHVLRRRRA